MTTIARAVHGPVVEGDRGFRDNAEPTAPSGLQSGGAPDAYSFLGRLQQKGGSMRDKRQAMTLPGGRTGAISIGLLGLAFLLAWLVLTPGAGAAEQRATATKFTIGIATTPLGKIVVDSRGRSLYLFEADRKGKSACYGACAKAWPPVLVVGKPKAGPGARAALLGVLKRKDGKDQATYRGHPLYRFFKDTKSGQVKGQGLDFFGGEWYVLTPAGIKLEHAAGMDDNSSTDNSGGTTTGGGTTTDPGGGYGGGYG
jgi:predicted lipoprotein with Yx(FWY)xxD motif